MQELADNLMQSISALFGAMYAGAPLLWGSKYPIFFLEILAIIIVFDIIVFGWRPLVTKFAKKHYAAVDYVVGQVFNVLALILLIAITIYLAGEMGDIWGRWLGISGVIWLTVGIIAIIFVGRFITTRSFISGGRRNNSSVDAEKAA